MNILRSRRWITALFVVPVFAFVTLVVAASPIPRLAAHAWAVTGTPRKADVIVVLGGGSSWPGILDCASWKRFLYGIWLYEHGYALTIIFSGGGKRANAVLPSEAELMGDAARKMGVRSDRIVIEPRSSRTYENGVEVAAIMRQKGWRSILLVTDAIHMRRATMVFTQLGFDVYPAPSHTSGFGRTSVGQGLVVLEQIGHEMVGIIAYKLWGWI